MRVFPLTATLLLAAPACITPAAAQSVSTTPVGAVTVNIAAGTGTSRVLSVVSFPLLQTAQTEGAATGTITTVTANTISASSAGWTAGELSIASAPRMIQITSGSADGRMFLISRNTPNTSTGLTIDAEDAATVDLINLGIIPGDSYRILECDTLSSLFPGSSVQGGTTSTTADVVQVLVAGSYSRFFYNTSANGGLGAWQKIAFGTPNSDNLAIRPDAMVLYNRMAPTPISISVVGDVPNRPRGILVANAGLTVVSTYWPVDTTLGAVGIEHISGWVSGSSSVADVVSVFTAGSWSRFYHDGTSWRKIAFGTPVSDSLVIPVGSGVLISKRGSAAGYSTLAQSLPYSL